MPTYATIHSRGEVERWLDYQELGIYMHPIEIVQARCGECRNQTGTDGQLIATVRRHPTGVWWWVPRHLASTSSEVHRVAYPLSPTGLFADLDDSSFEELMELRCRRHLRRPRSRVQLQSRVQRTWDEGFWVMHV